MSTREPWKTTYWLIWAVVGVIVIVLAFWLSVASVRAQKPDPVVRKIQHAVLYRSKDCIVTRVTVSEPVPWRQSVVEFYVVEGGVSFDRPIPPKCYIRFP